MCKGNESYQGTDDCSYYRKLFISFNGNNGDLIRVGLAFNRHPRTDYLDVQVLIYSHMVWQKKKLK